MAIMVGSFTLQLPTSASVATLLAFAKPWHYCMLGGNFLCSVDLRGAKLIRRIFLLAISDHGHPTTKSPWIPSKLEVVS